MLKIHFLGTGDGTAQRNRKNTSLLLEFDKEAVLIDCSGLPTQAIQVAECRLEKLRNVVLTHNHVDHIYAVPSLLHSLWLRKPADENRTIRIHGLDSTLGCAEALIEAFELRSKPSPLDIGSFPIEPEVFGSDWEHSLDIEVPGWQLTAFPVSHGATPAIGIEIIRNGGERILFSGDAVVDKVLVSRIQKHPYIVIHDCGGGLEGTTSHAGAKQINKLIRGTSVESVYLTHLPRVTEEEIGRIIEVVSSGFAGSVVVPQDGLEISVP